MLCLVFLHPQVIYLYYYLGISIKIYYCLLEVCKELFPTTMCATNIGMDDVVCLETDSPIHLKNKSKLMKYYVFNIIYM